MSLTVHLEFEKCACQCGRHQKPCCYAERPQSWEPAEVPVEVLAWGLLLTHLRDHVHGCAAYRMMLFVKLARTCKSSMPLVRGNCLNNGSTEEKKKEYLCGAGHPYHNNQALGPCKGDNCKLCSSMV